jgi:hypothetical protein
MELHKRIKQLEVMGFKVVIEIGSRRVKPSELTIQELKSTHHTTYVRTYLRKDGSYKVIRLHKI